MELEIIYRDEDLIAINKPHGLFVHPTKLAGRETAFANRMLQAQIEQYVYPIHRIDRKTSGVLLFGFSSDVARLLYEQFFGQLVKKRYVAIVRGFFPESVSLDYPLINDRNKKQDATTDFRLLKTTELPIPYGAHPTSRYSLIEAFPKTGRMHQIRKHLKHLKHPIIGDRPHGCNKQNKLFKERWNMTTMLLHAQSLTISHPYSKLPLTIEAPFQPIFKEMQVLLNLEEAAIG